MPYKIVAVDFDGVLSQYQGWKGLGVFGPPFPGASEALHAMKNLGLTIVIFTTRSEEESVKQWLKQHDMPFDFFNKNPPWVPANLGTKKVIADVYIDDRGLRFENNWDQTLAQLTIRYGELIRNGK